MPHLSDAPAAPDPSADAPRAPGTSRVSVTPDERAAGTSGDLELVRRAARGDGGAFHDLVDRHAAGLLRLARSLCGNAADAEDLVQETFTGAFRGLDRFQGRSSVKTWLSRILVLQVAKWRRSRMSGAGPPQALEDDGVSIGSPDAGAAAIVARRLDLQAALQSVTPDHREVVVLREFQGLSYDQIAQALGVPRGTVESRLHRARAELRERLKAYLTT